MTSDNSKHGSVQFINVSADQSGQRIDNFLLNLAKGVPKSRIYRAIRTGEVRINKGRIRQTYKICKNDTVRIPPLRTTTTAKINRPFVNSLIRQQIIDSVLMEDDDLLVLNKPYGLAVHAGNNINQGIIEALRIIRNEMPYLELVHRLDRDTSGCLLLAKHRTALRNLQQQMINHTVDKCYLTLMSGNWGNKQKLVNQPIQKNIVTSGERMACVDPNGKYAKTIFIPIEPFSEMQLSEVVLHTGRTHQIRVHAAHIKHPIAGDTKYGERSFNEKMKQFGLKRLFLHAWKLGIEHPINKRSLNLQAPLPTELQYVLNRLRQ